MLITFVAVAGPELAERVETLLGPELEDREVIAVGAGEVAADRDAALAAARGEYVWFVEPGARLAPGAIAGVAERLRAVAPDVLLVGGRHRRLLARVGRDGVTSLDERPGLAAAAPGLAGKVFRRAYLTTLGVGFGSGEAGVTWPALLAAERVAAAPDARVFAPEAPDELAAYDAVFAFLAAHPELPDARRRLVLPAILGYELGRLRRAPGSRRAARFAALSELWRRHRRGDEVLREHADALTRGSYAEYRALEALRSGRRALGRGKRRAGGMRADARERRAERRYARRRRAPVDPRLALFAAYWYRGYACNPRAIYEKARELVPDMRGVWVVKREAAATLPPGVEYVVAGTPEYYDAIARAGVFVNNVNFPNHLVKRPGTVHVMTHHGTPLKTMGLDLRETPIAGGRMDFDALLRRCARWDYSVSSNQFSSAIWSRVYPTGYESLEVGYPRNDVLANATAEDVARARAELGIEPGQTAVLYAPTHREFRSSYVPVLDLAMVAEALGDGHVLLARAHYFYGADRELAALHGAGRIRDVAAHPSVEQLCLAADVLVTDYSSIMFDYAVLDRPIVIHAPDWPVYRALRGAYFDLMAEHPGVVATRAEEVVDALCSRAAWGGEAARARAAFRARFCALDDGHASERVVERVWRGG